MPIKPKAGRALLTGSSLLSMQSVTMWSLCSGEHMHKKRVNISIPTGTWSSTTRTLHPSQPIAAFLAPDPLVGSMPIWHCKAKSLSSGSWKTDQHSFRVIDDTIIALKNHRFHSIALAVANASARFTGGALLCRHRVKPPLDIIQRVQYDLK